VKRAFTVIEFMIVLSIIAIIAAIVIPLMAEANKPAQAEQSPTQPSPFVITGTSSLNDGWMRVATVRTVRDSQTGREYIVVVTSDGVAITPRLPQ
jgi:prepilin-type N-terminal cleavage/methylation domain-containing protein